MLRWSHLYKRKCYDPPAPRYIVRHVSQTPSARYNPATSEIVWTTYMATTTLNPIATSVAPAHASESEHFLQKIRLFSALSSEDCQHVVTRMKRRDFPPQSMIVREG